MNIEHPSNSQDIFKKTKNKKVNFPGKTGKKEKKKGTGKQKFETFTKPDFSTKSMAQS
jgi:hypothetical protein